MNEKTVFEVLGKASHMILIRSISFGANKLSLLTNIFNECCNHQVKFDKIEKSIENRLNQLILKKFIVSPYQGSYYLTSEGHDLEVRALHLFPKDIIDYYDTIIRKILKITIKSPSNKIIDPQSVPGK